MNSKHETSIMRQMNSIRSRNWFMLLVVKLHASIHLKWTRWRRLNINPSIYCIDQHHNWSKIHPLSSIYVAIFGLSTGSPNKRWISLCCHGKLKLPWNSRLKVKQLRRNEIVPAVNGVGSWCWGIPPYVCHMLHICWQPNFHFHFKFFDLFFVR